jgi:RNA polymerase sigma factor (TIGR02999 family)
VTKPSQYEITQLLIDWSNGDEQALHKLTPLVYQELRRRAHNYMRGERAGHTMQTADLVNEAFIRLLGFRDVKWQGRTHFFAIAAQLMRNILVDYARTHGRAKRGGGANRVSLNDPAIISPERSHELIALDEALTKLASLDQRKSRVVELRYFGGLSNKEIAELLKIAPTTVARDLDFSEAFLRSKMGI